MNNGQTQMLGSLQTKIMEVLWKADGPLKPAEVQQALGEKYAYTTVMTILKRLSEKKILARKMKGKVYLYSPVCGKNKFVERNLKNIFDGLVKSYGETAIANFVEVVKNSQEDMGLLKDYLKQNR